MNSTPTGNGGVGARREVARTAIEPMLLLPTKAASAKAATAALPRKPVAVHCRDPNQSLRQNKERA
jgi:hypothetical protein